MSETIVVTNGSQSTIVVETSAVVSQVGRVLSKTPDAGILNLDANYIARGEVVIVPLIQDTTLTITGGYDGLTFVIRADQDDVGGHNLTLSTGFVLTKYIPTTENLSVAAANTSWLYSVVQVNSEFYVMASNGKLT